MFISGVDPRVVLRWIKMSSKTKSKRAPDKFGFVDKGADESDSSESEESVYSGLEEEPDSSEEEQGSDQSDVEGVDDDEDDSDDDNGNSDDDFEKGIELSSEQMKELSTASDDESGDQKYTGNVKSSNRRQLKQQPVKMADRPDEYDYDSSDEEDIRNTVGNIPLEWYREYPHIGYDIEGNRLLKPKKGDQLDEFLNKMDNPNYWRTVTNKMTGQNVVLGKEDLNLIQNLQGSKHPDSTAENYEPWIDFFTHETMIHPVTNHPQHKRSFIPSKWEKLKVGQMVHALKMGWMKLTKPKTEEEEEQNFYMLWKDDEEPEITRRYRAHLPAPKVPLPGHAESYNPPPEYLLSKEEEEKWSNMEPEERRMNFLPQKYNSLRLVPAYKRFINERFERCLDLYLCPRKPKVKMNINPEDLIPKLPKPRDLQPFPTSQVIVFRGHDDIVRTISVDPTGQWLVSGSDDGTVRFWEVSTGRCMKYVSMEKENIGNSSCVKCVAWNPNPDVSLVAVAVGLSVLLINPGLGDKMVTINTDNVINSPPASEEDTTGKKLYVNWSVIDPSDKRYEKGVRFTLQHAKEVSQVTWHGRGDYFASVMPKGDSQSVLIHQLSRRRSQNPFTKSKGLVQCVLFHPVRPFLFVATQRYVRVYNLLKQELSKKLMTNCKWVSSMTVHSGGDNVIVGSYDCRLSWFDLDLSMKPYQTLRHHKRAIRAVNFHRKYPLFASASDDGTVIVCHGMVYNDLLKNPLIVPVKILKGHSISQGLGVLDCVFHPSQPWVFSCGADTTIRLFT
ncbi:ribosome biogenesis protein bop1-A-like [Saccostrea echinata]|uniref:ribosome biogenesis protein bop1-A-like n=1 Tax=Saccostrea echinata TaxID=191078 RepID=UPI002A818A40|nr:ribosome biogenesis protein bop1-A-like [Saccostrea echinata]